jgi:molybdopterin synthase sulfur carrier subunit
MSLRTRLIAASTIGRRDKMAKVTVRFFATVREAAGTARLDVDAGDLSELLIVLKDRSGPALSKILDGLGSDPEGVVMLINGRNLGRSRAFSHRLLDGDEVAIFPPVSGG